MKKWFIRQRAQPDNYLNVDIDPGGMSVCWVQAKHATPFESEASAQSMVARLAERYPNEAVDIRAE